MSLSMVDSTIPNESKKRARDESGPDPDCPESKCSRVASVDEPTELDRVDSVENRVCRVDSDIPEMNTADDFNMPEDILHILEDTDIESSVQGLDSVIKSFEEEIKNPFPARDPGELDYLLGASDDELGLPPAITSPEANPETISSGSVTSPYQDVELKEDFAFVDELPSYDSADFGIGEDYADKYDFVSLGGSYDYYSEMPEFPWQQESLSAL